MKASLSVLPMMAAFTGWLIRSGGALLIMPNGSSMRAMTNSSREAASSSPSTRWMEACQVVLLFELIASVRVTGMFWFPCSSMVICSSWTEERGRRISAASVA